MIQKQSILIVLLTFALLSLEAQQAVIRDTVMNLKTYPFFDPNPVPRMSTIYPYFSYEGYSHEGSRLIITLGIMMMLV